MKTNFDRATSPKDILLYAAAYLLWFINILACTETVIQILSLIDLMWVVFKGDRYALSFVNQLTLLVGGLIAFIFVMSLEHTYRACVDHEDNSLPTRKARLRTLLRYFARTTAIPLGIAAAAFVVQLITLQIFLR